MGIAQIVLKIKKCRPDIKLTRNKLENGEIVVEGDGIIFLVHFYKKMRSKNSVLC